MRRPLDDIEKGIGYTIAIVSIFGWLNSRSTPCLAAPLACPRAVLLRQLLLLLLCFCLRRQLSLRFDRLLQLRVADGAIVVRVEAFEDCTQRTLTRHRPHAHHRHAALELFEAESVVAVAVRGVEQLASGPRAALQLPQKRLRDFHRATLRTGERGGRNNLTVQRGGAACACSIHSRACALLFGLPPRSKLGQRRFA